MRAHQSEDRLDRIQTLAEQLPKVRRNGLLRMALASDPTRANRCG
jgi:hypothetical protein